MGAFKAYDIRGIYGKDFDKETVYRIGWFLPKLIPCDHILVGRDVRVSSDEVHTSLLEGITDAGVDVWDLGLATTPMVYFATAYLDADCSVQITASHNPREYNGLKISRKGALPVGGDSGLKELEEYVNSDEKIVPAAKKGEVIKKLIYDEYVAFQKKFLPDFSDLDISIDCSNGMANLFVKKIFGTGENVHYLYDEFDGTFPNHEPNPLEEKNCIDLEKFVVRNGSDLGIIYDGDADRVMFIDEKGRFIQPDYITAVIGYFYKKLKKEAGNVLQDIRTSRSTTEFLESLGDSVTTWKVGHAFAKRKLREIKGIFGGELAGHYYFRDFYYCDSGILASLIVLSVAVDLKKEGRTISGLIDEIVRYANSGECNFKLEQKDDVIRELLSKYGEKADKILDFDGYRVEFADWWFNVRKSNTEPFLRLVMEGKSKELLKEKKEEIEKVIRNYK